MVVVFAPQGHATEESGASTETSSTEKLFYKISLNESVFIQEREATVNARATVEVLQGEMDKVTLEVFGVGSGQGEIFNVSGEKVKDWSLRRENTRTFLEIRPKNLGDEKTFTLTITGRQPLKLPTTISPILFSGVETAAFFGVVQFLSNADLRLYSKQERGLILLGNRSRSEINYAIMGRPSLRLDIARANELLAPVSLEDFSLVGDVESSRARFRLRAKAHVREVGAEVPVLTGNAALVDFPEKNSFLILAETEKSGASKYLLRFPARGEFDVDLLFDAGIEDVEGWQRINFSVPVAQVGPYLLKGMPADTVFAADNVSIPQASGAGVFSGFLPSSGALDLRWRPSILTPPEFSYGVYSIDAVTEMAISTGVLAQKSELNFSISQGELSSLFFEIHGDGEILSVEGQDLLSWREERRENGGRVLFVQLSQPKSTRYSLRILSQTRTQEFPQTLMPLRFSPSHVDMEGLPLTAVCVRNNEFLRILSGVGIRCEAEPQPGLAQVVSSAFPQEGDFFEKNVPAEGVSVYRLSSEPEKLRVNANFVRSDLVVSPRVRWTFDEGKITSVMVVNFEVRDAPLYEMEILVPEDLELTALDSEFVASYDWGEDPGVEGYRSLKLVFTEPFLGTGKILMTMKKTGFRFGKAVELRACLFPQAHFGVGVMGLAAPKDIRLLPDSADNLSEIEPTEYSEEYPPQLAFRLREGAWNIAVRPEKRDAVLSGVSSCVYRIGHRKVKGDFVAEYASGGVPVTQIRLAFPQGAKVLSVSGKGVCDWDVDTDGTATVLFDSDPGEKFSVSATFEEYREDGKMQDFEGVALLDVQSESGTILLTADNVLTVSGEESVRSLSPLPLTEAGDDYIRRGGTILFRIYQFVDRPFRLSLETHLPAGKKMPPVIVTEAKISANSGASYNAVYRYRNFGAAELQMRAPEGMKIVCAEAKEQADGTMLLPLLPKKGEISVRVEPADAESRISKETTLMFPQVDAPIAKTVFSGVGEVDSDTMTVSVSGRILRDELDLSLLGRLLKLFWGGRFIVFPAFIVLVAAVVAANVVTRKLYYRICVAIALAAGTLLSVMCVRWLVNTVRPEYGEAILTAGPIEAGSQIGVTVRQFYFLGMQGGATMWSDILMGGIFVAGVFLLLCGVAFSQWRQRLRIVGRVLLYTVAGIVSLEDFPHRLTALIAIVVAVEFSVFFLRALCRFIAKLIASPGRVSGQGTGLMLAVSLMLAAAFPGEIRANETLDIEALSQAEAPVENERDVADRISQAIDVRHDRIVARGDIRVSGFAGDRFDLLASPAVLTSFEKVDNAMLRLERRSAGNAGFVYQVVLERAGTFSANFSYELALSENARGFPILSGAAAADVATVMIPRTEVQVSAVGAVTTTLTALGEKSQIAQIVFKPKVDREVRWNPRVRDRSRESLHVFATGENLYVPSAGLIEGRHVMHFVPAQGEVPSVRIRVPKPFTVSKIEGPAIHRWNFNRDLGVLTVLFTAPRVSDFSLSVFTQAPLSILPTKQKFSALDAMDSDVQVQTIGLATGDALQVDAVHAGQLIAIDEDEFLEAISDSGLALAPELRLRRAFKALDGNGDFEAELSAVKPNLRISGTEAFFVNSDSVRADINLSASVSRAEIFSIALRISEGLNVDMIHGEALSYWEKVKDSDGRELVILHLKSALSGEQSFRLTLSGAFPKDAKAWNLPEIEVVNAKTHRGEISVTVDKGLRLKPTASGAAMLLDAEPDESGNDLFRFRYFSHNGGMPKFEVLESKPFTHASWIHKISSCGRYAFSQVDMVFNIENVMLPSIRVRLPQQALSARFLGDEIVSAKRIEEVPGLWELKFSRPIRGRVSVVAEFFTQLPLEQVLRLPPVSVPGADHRSAWLAVERGRVFSGVKSHSPETVEESDVPENFQKTLSGKEWFVEKFAEKYPAELIIAPEAVLAWKECLVDTHSDSFAGKSLTRSTVFSPKGAYTEEKILLNAKRSDVLRIALPQGGSVKSVAVDGVPVEIVPVPEVDDSSVWVPIFARGDAPVEIDVFYTHPLHTVLRGDRRVYEIVPAEIVHADRISWSVRPLDCRATLLDVFGHAPEKILQDVAAGAEILSAYFDGASSGDFNENGLDDWETFVIDGKMSHKPRVLCVFGENAQESKSDFIVFLGVFIALVLAKIVSARRKKRKS